MSREPGNRQGWRRAAFSVVYARKVCNVCKNDRDQAGSAYDLQYGSYRGRMDSGFCSSNEGRKAVPGESPATDRSTHYD